MGVFKIDVSEFIWINDELDDPEDRCLHGVVTAQIGDECLQDAGTVSSTALYLLKTLTEDHHFNEENLMILAARFLLRLPIRIGIT